jgi:hypothetical protein
MLLYPSALVGGTATGALPLAGWDNWDCSLRNCPKGHASNRRNGFTADKEVQRVVCSKSATLNTSDYMVFAYMGALTGRIYVDYGVHEIRAAIEENPFIGNDTVWFPRYENDTIATACAATVNVAAGGFNVRFETEFGDLPLLDSLYDNAITITEETAGTSVSAVCI